MDGVISYQFCYIITLYVLLFRGCFAQTISLTTPVNPVEQEGILSIHCQIAHLNSDDHEVNIQRTMKNKRTEKLSVDEGVLQSVDDRVFLATRKLIDGSTVFFLSITDVSRKDEGDYFCKVITKGGTIREIASESVAVSVTYFPDDSEPSCLPLDVQQHIYQEGDDITLNCSSDIANPPVSIHWSRTSGPNGHKLNTNEYKQNGRVYSTMTLKLRHYDDNAVYICKMTSVIFPDREQTCHVGPLRVIANENRDVGILTDSRGSRTELTTPVNVNTNQDKDISRMGDYSDCEDVCPVKSTVMYWVIATVMAAALSIVFFIIAIALLIKYLHAPRAQRSHYISARQTPEDIYSELECRRFGEGKVYMSLDKSGKPPDVESMPQYGIHYHEMPGGVVKVPVSTN